MTLTRRDAENVSNVPELAEALARVIGNRDILGLNLLEEAVTEWLIPQEEREMYLNLIWELENLLCNLSED